MSDIDSLIRERLDVAAAFDVHVDPRRVREDIARRQRRFRRRRRATSLLCVLAVAGVALGVVRAVDRDSGGDVSVTDAPERASDDSEASTASRWPRFLPAPGWEVVQGGLSTTAANIPLGPNTRSGGPPWDTVDRLEEGDVVLYARVAPAGKNTAVDAEFPPGELPLSLDDAQPGGGLEGQPDNTYADQLLVQVNGWNLNLHVFYGGTDPTGVPPSHPDPSTETRAVAQEQLARLEVPPRTERRLSPTPDGACEPSNLQARVDLNDTGAMLAGQISLRNGGDSPCALEGVPHIELRDASSKVISSTTSEVAPAWQQAAAEPPEGWPTIRVAPQSEAQAVLTIRNWCVESGDPAYLLTRLPYHIDPTRGGATLVELPARCTDPQQPVELEIGPLEPPRTAE